MLKKAGIVVAATTAGLLALSPLAFATSPDQEHHRPHDGHSRSDVEQTTVERDNQNVECDFRNNQATTGAAGLLGIDLGIPVNATIPIASCNNFNVSDVVDAATNNPNTEVASTR
jgi:hypothetical protein